MRTTRRVQATESSVKDARQLARHIGDLSTSVEQMQQAAQSVPLSAGNIVSVAFTAGVPIYVKHGLGRSFTGFIPSIVPAVTSPVLSQTFLASGTYVVPTNCNQLALRGWGGGGGGGGGGSGGGTTNIQNSGGSGGGGSLARTTIVQVTPGSSYAVSIGAGGDGGAGATSNGGGGHNGSDGGDTTFGSVATFRGAGAGLGGFAATSSTLYAIFPGGAPTRGGALVAAGGGGATTGAAFCMPPSNGGASGLWGGAAAGGTNVPTVGMSSPEGYAGASILGNGSNSGSEHGGTGGGGGGAGPGGPGFDTGGSGGNGNSAGNGVAGTNPAGVATTSAVGVRNTNTGAGGSGGGGGGYGSTGTTGAGGGGGGGDSGILYVYALLPSLISEVPLKNGQTDDEFIGLISAVSGTFKILVF